MLRFLTRPLFVVAVFATATPRAPRRLYDGGRADHHARQSPV